MLLILSVEEGYAMRANSQKFSVRIKMLSTEVTFL